MKRRFDASKESYERYGQMQLFARHRLVHLLEPSLSGNLKKVLEIGAGRGALAGELLQYENFEPKEYYANDIVGGHAPYYESHGLIPLIGDIENMALPQNIDLTVSANCFQWLGNLDLLFKKIKSSSKKGAVLAFSSYGPEHFKEIRELTGKGLDYISLGQHKLIGENCGYKVEVAEEMITKMYFCSPKAVLRYCSKTGVNSIESGGMWTPGKLQNFETEYLKNYRAPLLSDSQNRVGITVHYIFLIFGTC